MSRLLPLLFLLLTCHQHPSDAGPFWRWRSYRAHDGYCQRCHPTTRPATGPVWRASPNAPPNPFLDPRTGWEAWATQHGKVCERCRENPQFPLCNTAFEELQRQLQAAKDVGWHLSETSGKWVWEPPEERPIWYDHAPDADQDTPYNADPFDEPSSTDPY